MLPQTSRAKIGQSLQREIQSPAFQSRFNRLKKSHPELAGFNAPQDIVDLFHNGTNHQTNDELLHLLVTYYRIKPKTKGWLLNLLLLIVWKQMDYTFCRFGRTSLNRINPFDPFAPVYQSYIDAFLETSLKSPEKFGLHIKDRAEWLIKKELRECNRFKGEPKTEPLASELLPWQEQIDDFIWDWTSRGVLNRKQSELVINHIVYEFTFAEIAETQGVDWRTVQKQFQRAIKKLKLYLKDKYSKDNQNSCLLLGNDNSLIG